MASTLLQSMKRRRASIISQMDKLRADLERVDKSILYIEAMERARSLGIRITSKSLRKVQAWGAILILLEREGPLTTRQIKEHMAPHMAGEYATLRSYLFRMELDKLLCRTRDKRWDLTDSSREPVKDLPDSTVLDPMSE